MEVILKIARVRISLYSDYPITVDAPCADFVTNGPEYDVRFHITGWAGVPCPSSCPVGQDKILRYYQEGNLRCCEKINGAQGADSRTFYTQDFSSNSCFLRHPEQSWTAKASALLYRLPLFDLFSHFDASFLHAAGVEFGGKGVLFSAPSGTGKTTQAKLWNRWEGARMISGDRAIVRSFPDGWYTFGMPFDGSSPIRSAKGVPLGAVVMLRQGDGNRVKRLGGREAFQLILEQTPALRNDRNAVIDSVDRVIRLVRETPVYLLQCRPDRGAVECLKDQLLKDGVGV